MGRRGGRRKQLLDDLKKERILEIAGGRTSFFRVLCINCFLKHVIERNMEGK